MKIPGFTTQQSAQAQLPGVQTTASPSLAPIGEGLSRLAHGVANMGSALQNKENKQEALTKEKKVQSDSRWALDALEKSKVAVAEFMSNPDNNTSESFADDLNKFTTDQLTQWNKTAPSPEAADAFRQRMMMFSNDRYESALGTAEKTRMVNTVETINTSIASSLQSYRLNKSTPGIDPFSELDSSMKESISVIDASFGQRAPALARKLKEGLVAQVVMATTADSPEYAQEVLDNSTHIDEQTRKVLQGEINQKAGAINLIERDSFDRYRESVIASAQLNGNGGKLDIDKYKEIYPDAQAVIAKRRDDEQIDLFNKVHSISKTLAPMNSASQQSRLSQLVKDGDSKTELDLIRHLGPIVSANIELQETNPVQWLKSYNQEVQTLQKRASDSSEETRVQSINELNAAILKYQGQPPQNADPKEYDMYLGKATNDRSLMSVDEADENARYINQAQPSEVIQRIDEVLSRYPNEQDQYVAFNDMVKLGKNKIRQEYQLAHQNKGAWWLDTYIGAIKATDQLGKLSDEKKNELSSKLDANPIWRSFQGSMIGDNFGRAKEIEGFKNGIATYAQAMMAKGKPMEMAIGNAVDLLISSTMGFATVNGQPMMIERYSKNKEKPFRTDEDMSRIEVRLGNAIRYFDSSDMNTDIIPVAEQIQDPVKRKKYFNDYIARHGFYQNSNDGQSVSLYVQDNNGFPFQVLKRDGSPYIYNIDEISNAREPLSTQDVDAAVKKLESLSDKNRPDWDWNKSKLNPTNWEQYNPRIY